MEVDVSKSDILCKMNRFLLPSSNWYCARIIDVNAVGLIAYGSRNSVTLLKIIGADSGSTADKLNVTYYATINGHTNRISGVKFYDISNEYCHVLASVGEDNVVTVVDTNTKQITFKHDSHKVKITCVTWTSSNDLATCVLSGDDSGRIIMANVSSKKTFDYLPLKSAITCISCNKLSTNLIAIGYINGQILVIDLSTRGTVVFNVQKHNSDVISLCWAPFSGCGLFETHLKDLQNDKDSNNLDYLFVSSSRDKTIKIWSFNHQISVQSLTVPINGNFRKLGSSSNNSFWVAVDWPSNYPNVLLSTYLNSGNLMSWNLNQDKPLGTVITGEKLQHFNRSIFNIATFKNIAITLSMERFMSFWSINEDNGHLDLIMPTIGGSVYKLLFSPINAGVLAIGCGDATIRVWNVDAHENQYDVSLFWQGLKTKVTSLAWHPKKEGQLAYGTESGSVGIYNVLSNKPPSISKVSHSFKDKVVYTVCWGPVVPTKGNLDKLELYSCGGMAIFLHHLPFDKGAVNINNLLPEVHLTTKKFSQWTEITFKPDYSLMCLGNQSGFVEIFDTFDLKLLIVLPGVSGKNFIHCLKWHPQYLFNMNDSSKYQYLLAVASQIHEVHIYDLSEQISKIQMVANQESKMENSLQEDSLKLPINVSSCCYILASHTASIASLSWSPHFEKQLVTASFDGTVCVWDAVDRKIIACYKDHQNRVLSAEWSPADPNLIFSGGEDYMVRTWKISEQDDKYDTHLPSQLFKKKKNAKSNLKKIERKETSKATNDTQNCPSEDVQSILEELLNKRKKDLENEGVTMVKIDSDNSLLNNIESVKIEIEAVSEVLANTSINDGEILEPEEIKQKGKLTQLKKKKKKVERNLFPVTNRKESAGKFSTLDDCIKITDRMTGCVSKEENPIKFGVGNLVNLGVYGDRMDAYRLLKTEADSHIETGNLEFALQLEIWKGNISEALITAAEHEQLSDSLVSLAAAVSPQFWSDMCLRYVKQLLFHKFPHKAVLFLLANHKVYEAIEVLKTHVSYREAIVLAKFRLMPKDPLISQLVEEWAEEWLKVESNDCAAKCYLSIGQFETASSILSRKHDPMSVSVAAYIAKKAGNQTQAFLYSNQCLADCLVSRNFSIADEMLKEFPNLKCFSAVIEVHKIISGECWRTSTADEKMKNFENILHFAKDKIHLSCENLEKIEDFLDSAFSTISSSYLLSGSSNEHEMEAWISLNFALVAIQIMQSKFTEVLNRIMDMFAEAVNRVKRLYLAPLARSFFNIDGMSSLTTCDNLNSLFEGNVDCFSEWWKSFLAFLSLAKLHELLSNSYITGNNSTNFDDVERVKNILLDDDRALLWAAKAKLKYIEIAATVLSALKKENIPSEQNRDHNDLPTRLNIVHYDKILDCPTITLPDLLKEKELIETDINQLSNAFVVEKFPDPFDSCVQILELIALNKGDNWTKLFWEILAFGERYVVTARQSLILNNFKKTSTET